MLRLKPKPATSGGRLPTLRAIAVAVAVFASAFLSACEPQVYGTKLDHQGERAYLPGTDTPFTGVADVYYQKNRRVYLRTPYKNGFLHGFAERWHSNGRLASQRTYKDGEIHGLDIWWYKNGNKRWEIFYRNGKQHGIARHWSEDGARQADVCWQNGKETAMHECE